MSKRSDLIERMWHLSTIARSQAAVRNIDVRHLEKLVNFLDEWTLENDKAPRRATPPSRAPRARSR